MDNLRAHTKDPFVAAVRRAGKKPAENCLRFGPAGGTHLWQPVDHNIGAKYKFLMSESFHQFMADREDDDAKVTKEEQRILLTKWAGEAYRHL